METERITTLHRRLGVVSHVAVPKLFNGEPIGRTAIARYADAAGITRNDQPLLLPKKRMGQMGLFAGKDFLGARYIKLLQKRESGGYIRAVEDTVFEVSERISRREKTSEQWIAGLPYLGVVAEILVPVFGDYVFQVLSLVKRTDERYLALLTLLSWARALISHYWNWIFEGRERVLVREIPAFHPACGAGGWRMDAIEICSLNGQPISHGTAEAIRRRATEAKSRSVGHLLQSLESGFGNVEIEVCEWKFGVGDAKRAGKVIADTDVVVQPISEHERQVQRYIVLSLVDCFCISTKRWRIADIWQSQSIRRGGSLHYFLNSLYAVHEIILAPENREDVFVQEIVRKVSGGKKRAVLRYLELHLLREVTARTRSKKVVRIFGQNQQTLFPNSDIRKKFEKLVHTYEQKR